MKSPEIRQSSKHHEKKKSRRSPSSSSSPEVQKSKKRRHEEEHKKKHEEPSSSRKQDERERHLTDKNRDRSRDGARNESRSAYVHSGLFISCCKQFNFLSILNSPQTVPRPCAQRLRVPREIKIKYHT